MAAWEQLSRENFDRLAELHGITEKASYLDELYSQSRGVYMMAKTIRNINVSGVEQEMAFIPPTERSTMGGVPDFRRARDALMVANQKRQIEKNLSGKKIRVNQSIV